MTTLVGSFATPTGRGSSRPLVMASTLAVVAVGLLVSSWAAVVGAPLALGLWTHWSALTRRRLADERLATQVAPFVDGLIQQLKAGSSLAMALRSSLATERAGNAADPDSADPDTADPGAVGAELAARLQPLRASLAAGFGLEAALDRLASTRPDDDLALLVNTLVVLVRRGGPAVPSLERLNDTVRTAQWIELEVKAQAAQATASSAALAGLPAVFVVGLALLDRRLTHFYLFDVRGALCLIGATSLSYLGWWWMHRLIWGRR